jgi:hypothetical protein
VERDEELVHHLHHRTELREYEVIVVDSFHTLWQHLCPGAMIYVEATKKDEQILTLLVLDVHWSLPWFVVKVLDPSGNVHNHSNTRDEYNRFFVDNKRRICIILPRDEEE